MRNKIIYLSGPMTGLPWGNRHAFDKAATCLRAQGHTVINPAELDSDAGYQPDPDGRKPANYAQFLRRDLDAIVDEQVDTMVFLEGWQSSDGANAELALADALGIEKYEWDSDHECIGPFDPYTAPASGEVRVTDPSTGGQKGVKPQRMDLIPWASVEGISEVYHFGTTKGYEENNWRKGYKWGLSFGALMRHLVAWWCRRGPDSESGLSHLKHAGFHIMTLIEFESDPRYQEMDDRP